MHHRFYTALFLILFTFALGCSDTTTGDGWKFRSDTGDAGNDRDVGVDDTGPDPPPACPGTQPECSFGCGGDAFLAGECVDGGWECPDGTTDIADCPPNSCLGLPQPGEVCDDGWSCQPDEWAMEGCFEYMCLTCRDFSEEVNTATCHCQCQEDDLVVCEKVDPFCVITQTSDLDGVSIHFEGERCRWTLEEVANGIEIPYEIVVDSDADGTEIVPYPQTAGGCGQPGDSGLITFEEISGDEEQYCRCDTGLCQDTKMTSTLQEGSWSHAIAWEGRNWTGPSDFGNEPGDPFPPGTYTASVSAVGEHFDGTKFEVKATLEIEVTE